MTSSFLTIAHRGGSGLRPENTLAAFENALNLGCDGAELDVHLTRDGRIVVHHNAKLNHVLCRKRGSTTWITREQEFALSDLTYDELLEYEVGVPNPDSDYHKKFSQLLPVADQRIPLLSDVIRLVQDRSDTFLLMIEIKTPVLQAAGRPWRRLVDAVLSDVEKKGFAERVILCSFDWGSLIHAKSVNKRIRTWFLTHPLSWLNGEGRPPQQDLPPSDAYLADLRAVYKQGNAPWYAGFDPRNFKGGYAQAIAQAEGDGWFMYHTDFTAERAVQLKERKLIGATWSVNLRDPEELARLVAAGVDAHCTDYPE